MENPPKKRRQNTLDSFIVKTSTSSAESESTPTVEVTLDAELSQSPQQEGPTNVKVSTSGNVDITSFQDVSPNDVCSVILQKNVLSDADKINMLDNCWKPSPTMPLDNRTYKQKSVSFQWKWLEQRKWLAYSNHPEYKGGWCIPCVLFLSDYENEKLGNFVKTPFRNYNKSKELLDGHESKEYHKRCIERACSIRAQQSNVKNRIDVQVNQQATQNVHKNLLILPHIIDAVMLCAKQQIALRGHRDDKIDFSTPATRNEGNFIAIVRTLASSNPALKDYLVSGPKNARYTSKTIQNEIINISANLIRDHFRQCLSDV